MKTNLVRFAMAACVGFAAAFGRSVANANIITFGPNGGSSDSPLAFEGSLTYSGSLLTSWDLKATLLSNHSLVREWTQGNSSFTSFDDGAGLTISSDGSFSHD